MKNKILKSFFDQSVKVRDAEAVTFADMVESSSTHSLGGGQWSIELHAGRDDWSECLAEFVGSNGQCYNEEADNLWAEVQDWYINEGLKTHHYTESIWETPDGSQLTKTSFLREVQKGHLHGVELRF